MSKFTIEQNHITNGVLRLPKLPEGTKELDFSNCGEVTKIAGGVFPCEVTSEHFPKLQSVANVTFNGNVNLANSTSLQSLDGANFADNSTINLTGCTSLPRTVEFVRQLEALEGRGCEVIGLEAIKIDTAKARLGAVVNNYKTNNPEGAPKTIELFNGILSEPLWQRGGASEVLKNIEPFLDFIEKEPKHLKWVEEIAQHSLGGCVNQPVAGFAKIAAWMGLAKAPDTKEKLEQMRHIMAIDVIDNFVATSDLKPRKAIEVEAGNVLLREVHTKLVEDGMKPWSGVPDGVAGEGMVSKWLRPSGASDDSKINAAVQTVKEQVTNLPTAEFTDKLLNSHQADTFVQTAFPAKVTAIQKKYQLQKNELQKLSGDDNSPIPEKYLPKKTDGASYTTQDERMNILDQAYTNTDLSEKTDIITMAKNQIAMATSTEQLKTWAQKVGAKRNNQHPQIAQNKSKGYSQNLQIAQKNCCIIL